MKLPFRPPKKKKFQAATVRRAREADYAEEPNVKLSSAFVVVLLLHVVAVGGILAFNAIKTHQPPVFEETETAQPQTSVQPVATAQPAANSAVDDQPAATPASTLMYRVKSTDTIARIAAAYGVSSSELIELNNLRDTGPMHVGQELKLPAGAALVAEQPPKPAALKDSGNTYTVVHGDTPVSIARKLHVGFDDLIRLNKIDDPKKLKIGMKLKIPAKRQSV
jgi:LysM repeat protein